MRLLPCFGASNLSPVLTSTPALGNHCSDFFSGCALDLEAVADSISNAFVGVAEAADERGASLRLAPAACGLAMWLDIAADKADAIVQSLFIISEFPNLAEEVVSGAQETLTRISHLLLGYQQWRWMHPAMRSMITLMFSQLLFSAQALRSFPR